MLLQPVTLSLNRRSHVPSGVLLAPQSLSHTLTLCPSWNCPASGARLSYLGVDYAVSRVRRVSRVSRISRVLRVSHASHAHAHATRLGPAQHASTLLGGAAALHATRESLARCAISARARLRSTPRNSSGSLRKHKPF